MDLQYQALVKLYLSIEMALMSQSNNKMPFYGNLQDFSVLKQIWVIGLLWLNQWIWIFKIQMLRIVYLVIIITITVLIWYLFIVIYIIYLANEICCEMNAPFETGAHNNTARTLIKAVLSPHLKINIHCELQQCLSCTHCIISMHPLMKQSLLIWFCIYFDCPK